MRVYSAPVDRDAGLICHYPAHLRRIRYRDPETGKNLVFLTNQWVAGPDHLRPKLLSADRTGLGN